jgi:hypothetical protein
MIKQRLLSLMGWASLAAERKRSQPCVRIAGEWHAAENTTNRSTFFTSRYSSMSQPIIPAASDYRGSVRLRTALRPKTCDTVLVALQGDLAAQWEILRIEHERLLRRQDELVLNPHSLHGHAEHRHQLNEHIKAIRAWRDAYRRRLGK